jgi:hypothetical protein
MNLSENIKLFMSKSVPLVVVFSALDLMETATDVMKTLHGSEQQYIPKDYLITWDCVRGMQVEECDQKDWAMETLGNDGGGMTDAMMALERIERMLGDAKKSGKNFSGGFVMYMADVLLAANNPDRDSIVQYLLILRDRLTENKSMLVLVGIDFDIPASLKEHIALVSADLPNDEKLQEYVLDVQSAYEKGMKRRGEENKIVKLDDSSLLRLRDTLRGQTTFSAKQNLYLAIDKEQGISQRRLQERAIHTINSTKGLSVLEGDGRGFKALGGLDGICDFSLKLRDSGRCPIELVVFMDEIEKAAAGGGGTGSTDTSGVSSNMLGTWLTRTSKDSRGYLCTGVYGAGKSEFALRFAEENKVMCVSFSLADMKESLVGNSESNIKRALDVVYAIGGKGVFWIGTSNRITQLTPEIRRRFNFGTYFFDFPNEKGRDAIWEIYCNQYGISYDQRYGVQDENWTGAEIKTCCELAHILGIDLADAAVEVTLVKNTAKTEIERLQMDADGKYKDAAHGGVYQKNRPKDKAVLATSKKQTERDITI